MTKRILTYLFIFLVFYSCSMLTRHPSIEPDFKPYYDEFLLHAGVESSRIRMGFKRISSFIPGRWVIGRCNYLSANIDIDPVFWHEATEYERKALIFHELGHCLLWRLHNDLDKIYME